MVNKDNPCRHGDTSSCIQPNFKAVHANVGYPVILLSFFEIVIFKTLCVYVNYRFHLHNTMLNFKDCILKFV